MRNNSIFYIWMMIYSIIWFSFGYFMRKLNILEVFAYSGLVLVFIATFDRLLSQFNNEELCIKLKNDLLTLRKENTRLEADVDRLTITNHHLNTAKKEVAKSQTNNRWKL